MILPSDLRVPTTEGAGYFKCDAAVFANWLANTLTGGSWKLKVLSGQSLSTLLEMIAPNPDAIELRHLCLPIDGWTVLQNDGPLGTDVGNIPLHAAEGLNCTAIRAVAVARGLPEAYPATILEVYEPSPDLGADCTRAIAALNDGGRWTFSQYGEPYSFENVAAYSHRRVRNRFTVPMLEDYLIELGVPVRSTPDTETAFLVALA